MNKNLLINPILSFSNQAFSKTITIVFFVAIGVIFQALLSQLIYHLLPFQLLDKLLDY